MSIISFFIAKWNKRKNSQKWRSLNQHNFTRINDCNCEFDKISIGRYSYGDLNIFSYGDSSEKLVIGDFVSIARDVKFILGGKHQMNTVSTYPFQTMFFSLDGVKDGYSDGPIYIEDHCWIATSVTILSGVRIGKGSIIGANSIVTHDIPPYSVCAGVPAQVMKKRHTDYIISKLDTLSTEDYVSAIYNKKINLLYIDISDKNIDAIIENIKNASYKICHSL